MTSGISYYSVEPASFQDPSSGVIWSGKRIFRFFDAEAAEGFRKLAASGALGRLIKSGKAIPYYEIGRSDFERIKASVPRAAYAIEHPVIPFISYAYEWPFNMLRDAATLLLDVQIELLQGGFVLRDGRSSNVQYVNGRPTFIDLGSIEPYTEGNVWTGYAQFCHKFLNPLLFQSATGLPFQTILRGNPAGISPGTLYRLLSWPARLGKNAFIHVTLQTWLNNLFAQSDEKPATKYARVDRDALIRQARSLKKTIGSLKPGRQPSNWLEYNPSYSYSAAAASIKRGILETRLARLSPGLVYDCGCNTGEYSLMAEQYSRQVVAMDFDPAVVDALYRRCRGKDSKILPLVMDMTNPSPEQGWGQEEYHGLERRAKADIVLWLALTHHLGLTNNIPLEQQVDWISRLGHSAVIEFVPAEDPMARTLCAWRNNTGAQYRYTRKALENALRAHFTSIEVVNLPESARSLYIVTAEVH